MNGANSVRVTEDGGFVVFGEGLWSEGDDYEVWQGILVRTDAAGNLLWHGEFGLEGAEEGYGLAVTRDGGFLVGGFSRLAAQRGGYCVKSDATGRQLWWRQFETPMVVAQIQPVQDGYLLIGAGGARKIDDDGTSLWTRTYAQFGWINSATILPDAGIVLVGTSSGSESGGRDVVLLRTDARGNPR
jgi:hypothetical protein